MLSGTYATPGPQLESSQTILQEPRKEYSPTRGLGSDLINLVAFLGDALGVVGIKKKNYFGDSMTKILVTTLQLPTPFWTNFWYLTLSQLGVSIAQW